jgi:hypothetical protein
MDRNSKPLNATGSFYPVSIPPAFLIILDVVINDKYIALGHLFKKAKPGKITRLKNPYDHYNVSSDSYIDKIIPQNLPSLGGRG